jgi:hypothetical protein
MRKLALGVSMLVVTTACGGDGPTKDSGVPSRTVLAQGGGQLGDPLTALNQGRLCDILAFVPVTTPATGTLDAAVDWTYGSNDIDLHLERGECTCDQALADACQDVASAESTTAKPEKLTVPNSPAGRYTLVIVNTGPERESMSYEVGLTR